MKIKICGITRPEETKYLNDNGVDYAGFVIFEKSKRYVTVEKAKELFKGLDAGIKKVAVVVSPDVALAKEIEAAGFDVLQVHKELSREVIAAVKLPIWYASNISNPEELDKKQAFLESLTKEEEEKVVALVVDGAEYGSGKTFDWTSKVESPLFENRAFILAGGLNCENVAEGIRLFAPDMVDVSSGVEGACGKDEDLIKNFVERVRENEQ